MQTSPTLKTVSFSTEPTEAQIKAICLVLRPDYELAHQELQDGWSNKLFGNGMTDTERFELRLLAKTIYASLIKSTTT